MSNYKTLSELTQDVIKSLSMYAGTAVQVYAEDRIAAMIIRIFNRLFEDRFWDEHTFWYKYTLTGEDGVVGSNVDDDIAKFTDIQYISTDDNPRYTLKQLHGSTNPYKVEGTIPTYFIPTQIEHKIFAVVPFAATGDVYVRARHRPSKIIATTVIPFDPDILVYGACYEYCADDGNSNQETQKFLTLYQQRLQQLINLDNQNPINWNDEQAYYGIRSWR